MPLNDEEALRNFLFIESGDPPSWYGDLTVRRALWKDYGLRPEEMTLRDYTRAVTAMTLEQKYGKKAN